MKELIARRYIKAMSSLSSKGELEELCCFLEVLSKVSTAAKFRDIMESPCIPLSHKIDFILGNALENSLSTKFVNFIKVLAEHKRLNLFKELHAELSSYLATLNKEHVALLDVADGYEDALLREIEEKFSKRLGVRLLLKQRIVPNAGFRLSVEDLGVEVSLSQEKFIRDFKNHILKAF